MSDVKQTWGPGRPKLSRSFIEHVRNDANKRRGKYYPEKELLKEYRISSSTFWWITRGWSNIDVPRDLLDTQRISYHALEQMRSVLTSLAEDDEREAEQTGQFEPIERARVLYSLSDVLDRAMTKRKIHNGETK